MIEYQLLNSHRYYTISHYQPRDLYFPTDLISKKVCGSTPTGHPVTNMGGGKK
jgi:hypothetical protein